MADAVLDRLSARNIFDLSGVVAVVTGGGTVGSFLVAEVHLCLTGALLAIQGIGLMITTTLVANGANVYIVGPQDKYDNMQQ